jgi:hypothetical protein
MRKVKYPATNLIRNLDAEVIQQEIERNEREHEALLHLLKVALARGEQPYEQPPHREPKEKKGGAA